MGGCIRACRFTNHVTTIWAIPTETLDPSFIAIGLEDEDLRAQVSVTLLPSITISGLRLSRNSVSRICLNRTDANPLPTPSFLGMWTLTMVQHMFMFDQIDFSSPLRSMPSTKTIATRSSNFLSDCCLLPPACSLSLLCMLFFFLFDGIIFALDSDSFLFLIFGFLFFDLIRFSLYL